MGGFIVTIIGVICKSCVDVLTKGATGENVAFTSSLFNGIAVLLTIIGILMTVIPAKPAKTKLIVLGIHAVIWLVGYFLFKFLVPIVIGIVAIGLVLMFLGINPLSMPMNQGSGTMEESYQAQQSDGKEKKVEKKVEVWRENGMMREHLKVNSTGDMYYDPEDGEWHKIKEK